MLCLMYDMFQLQFDFRSVSCGFAMNIAWMDGWMDGWMAAHGMHQLGMEMYNLCYVVIT